MAINSHPPQSASAPLTPSIHPQPISRMNALSGARVVPTAAVTRPTAALRRQSEWLYELRADTLPTVDLSLSLESRFLGRNALNRMKRFVRRWRTLGLAAWLALSCYFAVVLVSAALARAFAVVCIALWTPVVVVAHALLRYQMLLLLLRSYDFWFCTCVNTSTFVVLGLVMGGDARVLAPLAAWAGVQINIVIDANIRAVKLWAVLDIIGVVNCALTWAALALGLLDGVYEFRLLYYGVHGLPATAFVASGLLTVSALLVRNVYRKRKVFFQHVNRSVIECVSYRVNVRFQVYDLQLQRAVSAALPPNDPNWPEYEKKMKFVKRISVINARCTVLQWLSQKYHRVRPDSDVDSDGNGWLSCVRADSQATTLRWLAILTIVVSIASVFIDVYYVPVSSVPLCQLGALTLTLLYCGICGLHYQRQLLRELSATFDVLFLSAQLLVVHTGACDLFHFGKGTVVVLISWLWFLWLLLLDSMPPVIKARLGVTKSLVQLVVVVLISSSFGLIYLLVFAETSATTVRDRVLWHGHVFGRDVGFRLVPIFYNSLGTALFLVLRILWRVVADEGDVLVMLDGAVVYENYLRKARDRDSRRWGSIARTSANGSPRAKLFPIHPLERVLPTTTMAVAVRDRKELR